MLRWHAAIARPFSDIQAAENLKQQGFSVLSPRYRVVRVNKGSRITTEKPYLPGYVFVQFDQDQTDWKPIVYTRGVKQLMMASADRPAPIRESCMKVIIDRCDAEGYVQAYELDQALAQVLHVGSLVKVKHGAFEGYTTSVRWTQNDRLKIVLKMFGSEREVELRSHDVELVA